MFDFKKTLTLIKGAIFDPDSTWDSYLPEAGDWVKTAALLTGPLVVASGLISYALDAIFPNRLPFIPDTSIVQMLIGIVVGAVAAILIAFVVAILAGLFKGKNSFPLALAATSLAFVPGYVGNALIHVPWIGWLLSLGFGIYGLILFWRILPKYLEVPDASRVGHYSLSLVVSIVAFFVLATVVGINTFGSRSAVYDLGNNEDSSDWSDRSDSTSGMFAGLERQGKIVDAANADEYDPPGNGKLSKSQVRDFVAVLAKTRVYQTDQAERLEKLSERVEQDASASISEAISGMAGVVNITNAEMEVVKTGGGNWAEHEWVRDKLYVARIQKDINDEVKHNYELYFDFEEELQAVGF